MFELVTSNTRTKFPLDRKKILKKAIANSTSIVLVFFVFGLMMLPLFSSLLKGFNIFSIGSIISYSLPIIILLMIIVFVWQYFYEIWYFNTYYYDLTEDFVHIRKGILANKEISIPYERIQDVYVDQDILDRVFGLYDVHLSSATASSTWLAHIDGVGKEAADGLKNILLLQIQQKRR